MPQREAPWREIREQGFARSYGIDLKPYASDYGLQVLAQVEQASIVDALGHYPGLTWEKLVKPEYADPNSVPPFVVKPGELTEVTVAVKVTD